MVACAAFMEKIILFSGMLMMCIRLSNGLFGAEGCEDGWRFYKNHCYDLVVQEVHFDTAKGVCLTKGSTLSSLWKPDEMDFVTDMMIHSPGRPDSAWIGVVPSNNNKWVWLDGSTFDFTKRDTPAPDIDLCAMIKSDGRIAFIDCERTAPAFVCKKSVEMLFVPSNMNITEDIVQLNEGQTATIFERLWPPMLDLISLDDSRGNLLATVDVTHETDCAFRCYTVEECNAFVITCKSARKCNIYFCSLLSGVVHE